MAGTENNAAIAAALQAEESRKWNPFVKGQKGFNTQNDRVHTAERRMNSPHFKNAYPLIKTFIKNPYQAGRFCKKFGYYEDCKVLKQPLYTSSYKYPVTFSNDKRSLFELQSEPWKIDYLRGFNDSKETNARNGKNFTSKYGRTRSKRSSRRVTRKRV
jgi:hypothetical protein